MNRGVYLVLKSSPPALQKIILVPFFIRFFGRFFTFTRITAQTLKKTPNLEILSLN